MPARRRIPPMPIEDILDHPKMVNAPAAARGMLWELCAHFWRAECAEFTRDEDTLRWIMKAHRPTFRTWKVTMLEVFDEIRPRLERALERRDNARGNLDRLRERYRAMRKAKSRSLVAGDANMSIGASAVRAKRKPGNKAAVIERQAIDDSTFMDVA